MSDDANPYGIPRPNTGDDAPPHGIPRPANHADYRRPPESHLSGQFITELRRRQQVNQFGNYVQGLRDEGNTSELARIHNVFDHRETANMFFDESDRNSPLAAFRGDSKADPDRAAHAMDWWQRSNADKSGETSDYDPYMHISLSESGPDYHHNDLNNMKRFKRN